MISLQLTGPYRDLYGGVRLQPGGCVNKCLQAVAGLWDDPWITSSSITAFTEDDFLRTMTYKKLSPAYREARDRALSVLCNFTCEEIEFFYFSEYPAVLVFVYNIRNEDGEIESQQIYDVTPINRRRMETIVNLLPDCWRNRTPKGGEDEVFHIAVVQDRELASELQPYGLFHAYTTGEEDKHGQIEIFTY